MNRLGFCGIDLCTQKICACATGFGFGDTMSY